MNLTEQKDVLVYALNQVPNALFKLVNTKVDKKRKKINTLIYKPISNAEVYIKTIDNAGNVKEQKVTEFYIHFGLSGFKITYNEEANFYKVNLRENKSFIVSNDHSILVYNMRKNKIEKATPKKILRDINNFYFLVESSLVQNCKLLNSNVALIPASAFIYEEVNNVTMYDFSVEDDKYCNFQIANGLYLVDTVVAHALHSEEAKKEAREKMLLSKQLTGIESYDAMTATINKNAVFGLVYGSLDPKEVKYK
ncbi:MAG: hypothetical protein ACP5G1_04320, partial [Nanopusillaceae archaeon]